MKYNTKNIRRATQLSLALSLTLLSCTDTWNEHYDASRMDADKSLSELIQANPDLSDFLSVCSKTHVYSNMRRTSVTYAQLLASDQTLTVWAPVNGSFDVKSLLEQCETAQGDSAVGVHFVTNHIAHNLYNMNYKTAQSVKMLNDKTLDLSSTALYNAEVIADRYNQPATNGLLHVLSKEAEYKYNVYEGLTSLPQYAHLGNFLKHYEQMKLDEDRSVQADYIDGQKVYSDSVMYITNALFQRITPINSEDSTYLFLAPSAEVWETVSAEAASLFNFGSVNKADSIGEYWKNVSLIQDLVYNMNEKINKSPKDSLMSTAYTAKDNPQHVYIRPYDADSLFDKCKITSTTVCSNGEIQNMSQWPFRQTSLYFRDVKTEAESQTNASTTKVSTLNVVNTLSSDISGRAFLEINPEKTSNWTVTFDIYNTLSGTYEFSIITLPKTAKDPYSKNKKPNKFNATVKYIDVDGVQKTLEFKEDLINSGTDIDTMVIGQVTLPVTSYMQPQGVVKLTINCNVGSRETKYDRTMLLDYILLRPIVKKDE